MRQVKPSMSPAARSRHCATASGGRGGVGRAPLRPIARSPSAFAPRIKRLAPAPDVERPCCPAATLVGESGANLILSRLQGWGIAAQPAMAGLPYDLIADIAGFDMLRIQVKTCSEPSGKRCTFTMRRGFHRSRAGTFHYSPGDFDIAAFVCLSLPAMFFYAGPVERISVRMAWLRAPGIDRETFELAIRTIRHSRRLDNVAWVASMEPEAVECAVDARKDDGGAEQTEFDFGFGR